MTLFIACLLIYKLQLGNWWYVAAAAIWVGHLMRGPEIPEAKDYSREIDQIKRAIESVDHEIQKLNRRIDSISCNYSAPGSADLDDDFSN
jgi:hypothetical protein